MQIFRGSFTFKLVVLVVSQAVRWQELVNQMTPGSLVIVRPGCFLDEF
jgi:hypothetical protein